MSNNLNLALRLSYDGRAVTTGARQNVNELNRIPQSVQRQIAANQQLGASQARIMQQQGAMTRQLGLMNSAYTQVGATLTALVGIGTATMFVRDTGAAQLLDTRLKGLTGSAQEYVATQDYLSSSADKLNLKYIALANSYSRILTLQDAGIVTQTEGKSILEGLANAAAFTGATNAQLEQSLTGMAQAMSLGVLQTTELDQVGEPLPGILQKIAAAAGKTTGEFRKFVGTGQVTSEMFKTYLIKALNEYAGAAEKTAGTINASFAHMGNEYQRLIRKYEQPVNFAVTSIVDSITDSMAYLRQNEAAVDNLVFATGALATVLTGHLVAGLSASAAGYVANVAAKNRALIADAALAKQNQANAVLELQRAAQMKVYAQHTLAVANTTNLRTAAVARLAAANTRYTATQAAATTATNIYTAAAGRATLAARGLSTVMGLLGGPVGALVVAGIALTYFISKGDNAAETADKFKGKVKELADGLDDLTKKGKAARLVEVNRAFEDSTEKVRTTKNEIKLLQDQIRNGFLISSNSLTGINRMERIPLSKNKVKEANDKIALQEAELETIVKEQNRLLTVQKQLKADIAAPEVKPAANVTPTTPTKPSVIPESIKRLEVSLMSEEARLKDSYAKRQKMINDARASNAISKTKSDSLLKQLESRYQEDANALTAKGKAEKIRIENEAEEKRKNDLQKELDNKIAVIKGHADRDAMAAYNNQLRVEQAREQAKVDASRRKLKGIDGADDVEELQFDTKAQVQENEWQRKILIAQGFQTQLEADEAASKERLMQIETRHTGALQANLLAFANFEKQTQAEKANAIVGFGANMFKTMAGQSKTAFKAFKALAIAQAVINTYQGATAAFTSAAKIPFIGHIMAPVAAAAAVMQGMQQVRQIKAQQPAGIAHGGLDYVPNESTYVLQRGERVLSPKQNTEISQMARRYNAGGAANDGGGSGGVTLSITNQITVQGGANEQTSQAVGQDIARQVVGVVVANIQSNGAIIKAVRATA